MVYTTPLRCRPPPSMLAARRSDDHSARNDLAMLAGARLVSINELPHGMRLDETVVKLLAGREPISARFLYKEIFSFRPNFVPWVRTNHKPIIKGTDDGIWRRLVIIPFRRKFPEEEQDKGLEAKLLSERSGILTWMPDACNRADSMRVVACLKQAGFERDGRITSGQYKGQARYVRRAAS